MKIRDKRRLLFIFWEQGDYMTTHGEKPWGCKAESVVTRYPKMTTLFGIVRRRPKKWK